MLLSIYDYCGYINIFNYMLHLGRINCKLFILPENDADSHDGPLFGEALQKLKWGDW